MKSSPYYALSQKYLPLGQGSIVTFGIKGGAGSGPQADRFGADFLAPGQPGRRQEPDHSSRLHHPSAVAEEQQKEAGVTPDLVRISVGIEDVDDLIWDLEQAIDASQK